MSVEWWGWALFCAAIAVFLLVDLLVLLRPEDDIATTGKSKTLLADAEHVGIALVQDNKTEFKTFWTLVIGSPL